MSEDEISYRETETKPTGFFVALDLGQAADYSALVVNQRAEGRTLTLKRKSWQPEPVETGWRPLIKHRIRFIHRYVLGTPYPAIVASTRSIVAQLPEARDKTEVWIDNTGVGRGVFDIFKDGGLNPVGLSITGGASVNRPRWDDVRVPKRELASLVQAALQSGRIEIARELAFSRVLEDELANFRVKLSAAGSETYEGRSGVHDDLVLSLAIACWAAEKRDSVPGGAMLAMAKKELEDYHASNGGKPQPLKPVYALGSMQYAEEQARLAAEEAAERNGNGISPIACQPGI
jgi:hypothetical protein